MLSIDDAKQEDAMIVNIQDMQWIVYESDALKVNMGWERVDGYLMDYYVVHQVGKKAKRFKGERAMWNVMRHCEELEHMSNIYIYERAMSAKSLS
jgi:hypothetical protein